MKIITKIITVLILALLLSAFSCGNDSGSGSGSNADVYNGRLYTEKSAKTANGVSVFDNARNGVDASMLPEVDKGFDKLFRVATEVYNYPISNDFSGLRVFLQPRSSRCEQAGFLVLAPNYAGTEYDKGGGTICAAGLTDIGNSAIIIVNDFATTATICRYEGEHWILYHVDPDKYLATQTHSNGAGHPILPDSQGQKRKPASENGLSFVYGNVNINGKNFCVWLVK